MMLLWKAMRSTSKRSTTLTHEANSRCTAGGDIFGKTEFDMTIWWGRDRRMLVRFWSKDDDIEMRAFKIVGMLDTDITGSRMMGDWIPYCLQVAYDGWISDEW